MSPRQSTAIHCPPPLKTCYQNYPGVLHEFLGMGLVVDQARKAEGFAAADELKKAFNGSASVK